MKVVFGNTLRLPVIALAMALMASAEARAELLVTSFDATTPQVYNAFLEFGSFDCSTHELRETFVSQEPFGDVSGAGDLTGMPPAFPTHHGDQIVEMTAATQPAESGAGASSSVQGPSGQQAGLMFSSAFPQREVTVLFTAEWKASLPIPLGTRLFRPPRV